MTMCTYSVLYFRQIWISFSWKQENLHNLNRSGISRQVNRFSLLLLYHTKQVLGRFAIVITLLIFTVGWGIGFWVIMGKSGLAYTEMVSVVVGFTIGFPSIVCLSAALFYSSRKWFISIYSGSIGIVVGIWALVNHTPLSHNEKVSIAVGMAVGIPCLVLTWALVLLPDYFRKRGILLLLPLLLALAATLSGVSAGTHLRRATKLSICLALGLSLPSLLGLFILIRRLIR